MNECFLIGNIIEIGKFKFILNKKRKSKITLKLKTLDGNIVKVIAYDEKADYILRNDFCKESVLIQGRLENKQKELYVVVHYIKKSQENLYIQQVV